MSLAPIQTSRTQNTGAVQAPSTQPSSNIPTGKVEVSAFDSGSDKLGDQMAGDGAISWSAKAPVASHTSSGSVTDANAPTAAQIAEANSKGAEGKALLGQLDGVQQGQESATGEYGNFMSDTLGQIDSNNNLIDGKSNDLLKSGKILQSNSAKQQAIAAWLENATPTIDQMNAQIDELTAEALSTIPQELGISAETLDEAMAQLSEMIDEEKLEELNQAQERNAEIDEKLEGMSPDDPEYDSLMSEKEGLQTVLQDPDNQVMMQASSALAGLADYTDAISEIAAAIEDYSVQIDAKSSELDATDDVMNSESSNIQKNEQSINVASRQTEDLEGDTEDKTDKFMEGYETTKDIASLAQTTGGVCKALGQIMIPYTPTTVAGNIINGIGIGLDIGGGVTNTVADVAAGVHTGNAAYFVSAAASAASTAASAIGSIADTKALNAQAAANSAKAAKAADAAKSAATKNVLNGVDPGSTAGKAMMSSDYFSKGMNGVNLDKVGADAAKKATGGLFTKAGGGADWEKMKNLTSNLSSSLGSAANTTDRLYKRYHPEEK